jgi:hypothetical protein
MLESRVPADSERLFEQQVVDAGVSYEHASAHLLGHDLRQLVNEGERKGVEDLIGRVRDPRHPCAAQGKMCRLGPRAWDEDPDELLERIDAFMLGFG